MASTSRTSKLPIPALRALRKLGRDVRDARRRRRIPVAVMAERASISRTTLSKVEKGEPASPSAAPSPRFSFVLGLAERLGRSGGILGQTGARFDTEGERGGSRERVQHPPATAATGHTQGGGRARRATDTQSWFHVGLNAQSRCRPARLWARIWQARRALLRVRPGWLKHAGHCARSGSHPGPRRLSPPRRETPLFGALGRSAPDRWGRVLMPVPSPAGSAPAGDTPRTLNEMDHLLRVNDEARQGALLRGRGRRSLSLATWRPPNTAPDRTARLLSAADNLVADSTATRSPSALSPPGLRSVAPAPKPGSGTTTATSRSQIPTGTTRPTRPLGGPALTLTGKAGIPCSAWRLKIVAGRPVLILRRFDRKGSTRIPFLSAMSMLGASDPRCAAISNS